MKIISTLFILLMTAGLSFAQAQHIERPTDSPSHSFKNTSEIMDVGDFTVVDSDGTEWNLHTLLEGGTTVIIDLFQAT